MNALILTVALMLAGECGSIGNGCEQRVAAVLANRVGVPEFGMTLSAALEGFYARAEEPTPESIRAARLLITNPDVLRDGRYYYAFSDDDCRTQGWHGEATVCGDVGCVHFSRGWPGD